MKKIILLFLGLLIMPTFVFAASGKINVTSSNTVLVGNKVTVTVKLTTGASWEMDLNYDKNYLQLVNGGGEAGGSHMVNTSNGNPNRTYTFTFKALKSGTTTVKIGSYYVVADDFSTVTISAGSKSIRIMTQSELEATYSKDNYLKSLSVDNFEINPKFDKNTNDYTLTVPEGTNSINIKATANDSKSQVTGIGEKEVSEGANVFKISVRAENGSEREYNLTVNVIDINPIEVNVLNEKYTLIKLRSNYTCPELFNETEVVINENSIPACYNENIDYTLVGLKNENGDILSFKYDHDTYSLYKEANGSSLKVVILPYDNELPGYSKSKLTIGKYDYDAFQYQDNSNYYVVYGINIQNGEKGFFVYDKKNDTLANYDKDYVDSLLKQNKIYLYAVILFGGGLFLALICIIIVSSKKKKLIEGIELQKDKIVNKESKKRKEKAEEK